MTPRRRVAALLFEGTVLYDLGTVQQVFGQSGGPGRPERRYDLTVCGARRGPVRTSTAVRLAVDHGLEALDDADLVVVPGITLRDQLAGQTRALAALRAAHARGARTMSICTGAFALAHAGLLDGRRATTHWRYCGELAAGFPAVEVLPDVLYVDEGDVLTSAGLSAGMDLCLHVVRGDFGAEAAVEVARWNVVAPHREGGQAQFIQAPVAPVASGNGSLAPTRAWALERLHEPLDVATLARHANTSDRTFARRFKVETGVTPKQWLLAQRVQHARRLLETTDLPIEEVASRSGFGSAAALRLHFGRATATRPTAYRSTFRTGA
jgi:AraC family transcriptional regulator, transcriptional activator FtrA